ncbi:hypothetical protein E3N88_17104 [Mikania micrantha]|uniref:Uncharacterized protein n=1 Tax=Mikania micrantha TaxID=192012 RepID=A0A5N6NTM5_9ASTR|nr:hypothetical protein E3N88_17104 [Mikania micrantha]
MHYMGFWRGNVPALLMVMPYTAIQFMVLHKVKTFASGSSKSEDHIHLSPYLSFMRGALAGSAATVGSYPFDLVRTILASQGEPKIYPTMRSAFVDIMKTRDFLGLYAGLSPTLVEIIPYAGLQFGTYDTFKRWTMAWNARWSSDLMPNEESLSSFQLLVCGLAAGSCAKAVCHPLDVVKKRFQIEGLQRHPRYGARIETRAYRNMFDALKRISQKEGWAGLYKGIVPSIVKAAPAGAVTFVAYEYTSDWVRQQASILVSVKQQARIFDLLDAPASQVSEILESELLGEGLIPTLQHAHDKLPVENYKTVPYRATTYGQVISMNCAVVLL